MFFKQCKSVKERYKSRNCFMSDDDGNLITGTQAITNLFKEYFEKLQTHTVHEMISIKK